MWTEHEKKAILALSRWVALQIQAIFNTAVKCQYPHTDTQYGITKMLIASGMWLEKNPFYNIILTKTATDLKKKKSKKKRKAKKKEKHYYLWRL